jgi:predicted GNAT family acetyltransferase
MMTSPIDQGEPSMSESANESTKNVTDNTERSRYELTVGDDVAFIEHVNEGDAVAFTHTEVPETMGGEGIGSRLVRGALDDARRRGLKVVPRCPFVGKYVARHPEYQDMVLPINKHQ